MEATYTCMGGGAHTLVHCHPAVKGSLGLCASVDREHEHQGKKHVCRMLNPLWQYVYKFKNKKQYYFLDMDADIFI